MLPMTPVRKLALDNRLNDHFAAFRSSVSGDARKRSGGSWQLYAAVTGSALAMATNASAGIIFSGPQNIMASVNSANSHKTHTANANTAELRNASNAAMLPFHVNLFQSSSGAGAAFVDGTHVRFLVNRQHFSTTAKRLQSGAMISSRAGTFRTNAPLGFGGTTQGWKAHELGMDGFSFKTHSTNGSHPSPQTDYGWVQLVLTQGTNGLTNSITAVDWAYDDTGSAIAVGETGAGAAPEPSTAALGLLAAGAAGVAALRRRRKTAA